MNTNTASHRIPAHGLAAFKATARAALKRGALDRRLLAGESPAASPELAKRAQCLLDRGARKEIATAMRETIAASLDPAEGPSSRASLNRDEILASQFMLLELAAILERPELTSIRGVIMARRLVTDMRSPLYAYAPPGALRETVCHARAALLIGS